MAQLLLGRTPDDAKTDVTIATDDLVTHGVIVGMTGSGKTGLGVGLIEECLNAGVPTLLIDPKGDLTNLALVFPGLSGQEFEPWVDPAQAKAAGVTTTGFAAQQAQTWKEGLAPWGIAEPQLAEFKAKFEVAIYTPGSTAGIPLNVLGSLQAPQTTDPEVVTDEIEGYVTSLLSVVKINADPLSSREHILLSNIIASAWAAGENIDLPTLLARVNQPPMRKLGVFDLDEFFPPKERMAFAMKLNAILAAPSFANWITGQPIDIQSMLWTPDGRPRAAIVTTAHLSDEDRQSATSLVMSKFVTWMRRQSGTTDLRALLYMDEVAGYLPPTANPPTKKPIMLLMKQARAFGVGVVLSTQNPVDVDYKAISNAGTWMIGRLTTENDKARLLEGMSSAAGAVDTKVISDQISGLGKRQFLVRKAGKNEPELFGTKWARSYLRGPMTRDQVAKVMAGAVPAPSIGVAAAAAPAAVPDQVPEPAHADDETPVMPNVADVPVAFLDPAAPWASQVSAVPAGSTGPRLEAAAVARVVLRYQLARADVAADQEYEAVIFPLPEQTVTLSPLVVDYDDRDLLPTAPNASRYVIPAAKVANKTYWTTLQRDLTDHLVATESLEVQHNSDVKLYSRAGESPEEFGVRCQSAAAELADRAVAALRKKYEAKLRAIDTKLTTATSQVQQAEATRSSGTMDSAVSVLGGLFGGRKSSSAISAAARKHQADSNRVAAAHIKLSELQMQRQDIETELGDEVIDITADWDAKAANVETVPVDLKKTNVRITDLRLVWVPVA